MDNGVLIAAVKKVLIRIFWLSAWKGWRRCPKLTSPWCFI
jgi:hypothetical protein